MQPTPPTPTPPTPTPPAPAKAPRRVTRNLPRSAKALSEAFDLAVAEWGKRPQLTLEWVKQPAADALATALRESLRDVSTAAASLTPQVKRLAELDKLIDGREEGKLKYVKKALALHYSEEDDGRPYYAEFGIEKVGSAYTLPDDRGKRAEALLKLVKALALPKHGLAAGRYGLAFWQPIADEYNKLQPEAARTAGTHADEVGDKNVLRDEAEAIFQALLLLIQANYPKTYKAERRKFGVLKESY